MSAPVAVNAPVAGRPVPSRLAASRGPRALSSGRAVGPRPPLSSRGSTAARFGRARGTLFGIARASSSRDARADDAPGSSDASDISSVTDPDELDLLVALLPPRVAAILRAHPRRLALLEVVLDLGRVPIARFADGDERLGEDVIDYDDVARALENVGDIGGDNRAGVNRTLHRISVIRNRARRPSSDSRVASVAPYEAAPNSSATSSRPVDPCYSSVDPAWERRRRFARFPACCPRNTAGVVVVDTSSESAATATCRIRASARRVACRCRARTSNTTCSSRLCRTTRPR